MADRELPSIVLLRKLIDYDPETGVLLWKPRDVSLFQGPRAKNACASWNTRHAGKPALADISTEGYFRGPILGRRHSAHRVAFAIYHNRWPDGQIDHINHDRRDNRIANLREVTAFENARNAALPRNNVSGVVGVGYHSGNKRWVASICIRGRNLHLGYFGTRDEAICARKRAEIEHGFHENHGAISPYAATAIASGVIEEKGSE